jgi:heme-degrading monooxygenase HmoA
MIVEIVRLRVKPGQQQNFETAWRAPAARAVINRAGLALRQALTLSDLEPS